MIDTILDRLLFFTVCVSAGVIAIAVLPFMLYALFVWLPVQIYADGRCTEAGYPGATVTFGLKGYCNDTALKRLVPLDAQP